MNANDVVLAHYDFIRQLCSRWALDTSERDDLAQSAVVAILRGWKNFKGSTAERRVAGWVKTVTTNTWHKAVRARETYLRHLRRKAQGYEGGWVAHRGGRPRKQPVGTETTVAQVA